MKLLTRPSCLLFMTPSSLYPLSGCFLSSVRNGLKAAGGELLTSFKAAQPLLRCNEAAWRLICLRIIVSICVCFPAYRCRLQQTSENRHRGGQGGLLEGGVPLADVWLCILWSESTRDRGADLTHFFVFIQSSRRHLFSKQNVFSLVFINFFSANVRTRSPRHCFDRY